MPAFFPRHTIAWHVERIGGFRGITLSVVESGVLTGVVLRVLRAVLLWRATTGWVVAGYAVGFVLILTAAAAAHLANYTIRQWVWRAPAFGALVGVGEAVTSLPLIAFNREANGASGRADFDDWPQLARLAMLRDVLVVVVFALVLAGVVHVVRSLLVQHEQRAHATRAGDAAPVGETHAPDRDVRDAEDRE
jgi:hypothetical protein